MSKGERRRTRISSTIDKLPDDIKTELDVRRADTDGYKRQGQSRDYFRALSLCRKPKATATFPSLTDEQKALIQNIWFDRRFAANLGTIEMLYEKFEAVSYTHLR